MESYRLCGSGAMKKAKSRYLLVCLPAPGRAGAREEPTRPLDIEWNEVEKNRFIEIEMSFAAEYIHYDSLGNLVVHASIVNLGKFTIDRVAVACTARNRDKSVVASTYSYTYPRRLLPAQKGLVNIVFSRRGRNIDQIDYVLNAQHPIDANDRPDVGGGEMPPLPPPPPPNVVTPYLIPGTGMVRN